jgi:hypothetical protein
MPSPNIYHAIVFDLHPRVREFLDSLDQSGQIDRDETNTPHVVSVESPGASLYRCIFQRNGKPENFVLHTRKRADPVRSWRDEDGYKRQERPAEKETTPSRKERKRRPFHAYESIVEQILRG